MAACELVDANQRMQGERAAAAEVSSAASASADTDQALSLTAPAHHAIAALPTVVYGGQSYPAGVAVPSLRAVLRDSTLQSPHRRRVRPTHPPEHGVGGERDRRRWPGAAAQRHSPGPTGRDGTICAAPPLPQPAGGHLIVDRRPGLAAELVAANKGDGDGGGRVLATKLVEVYHRRPTGPDHRRDTTERASTFSRCWPRH